MKILFGVGAFFGFGTRNPDRWWEHDVPTFQFDGPYLK